MKVKELIEILNGFDAEDVVQLNLDDDQIEYVNLGWGCDIFDFIVDPIKMDEGNYDIYLCPKPHSHEE